MTKEKFHCSSSLYLNQSGLCTRSVTVYKENQLVDMNLMRNIELFLLIKYTYRNYEVLLQHG